MIRARRRERTLERGDKREAKYKKREDREEREKKKVQVRQNPIVGVLVELVATIGQLVLTSYNNYFAKSCNSSSYN